MTVEYLADEQATLAYGARLAARLRGDERIFLEGELGAGKTTLVRGILRGLGCSSAVRSPTYTLVEPYELGGWRVYHLDLYRIGDSQELAFIGVDELMEERAILLVEWPERAEGMLGEPDYRLRLRHHGEGRVVEA